jgi:hypothetical protein
MVDVFLEPAAAAYGAARRIGRGGRLTPLALPDIALSIDDAFLAR